MKHLRDEGAEKIREELELQAVPPAIESRMRRVYAELPGELPATYVGPTQGLGTVEYEEVVPVEEHRMPWPLRGALAICGTAAAAFMLLLGLNFTYPEFTESLPGLGGIFGMVNGKNPMGTHLDTYDDLEQVSQLALANEDSGYSLTVDEAFCDGEYLYLTWEIECPEDADQFVRIVPYGSMTGQEWSAPGGFPQEDGFVLTIDGESLGRDPLQSSITETPENGKLAYKYVYPLNDSLKGRSTLQVNLSLAEMYGLLSESDVGLTVARPAEIIPVNFQADFPVTVNTTHNRLLAPEGQDNGVSVLEVESTPGYIKMRVEVPFWGDSCEENMSLGPYPKGVWDSCHLYTEDGTELKRSSNLSNVEEDPVVDSLQRGEPIQYTVGFDGAPADCQKVILRVFEYEYGSAVEGRPEMWSEDYVPNMFAELTIDLNTGEAVATDTYKQAGITKLDTEEYINTPHSPDFTGGYYVTGVYCGYREEPVAFDEDGNVLEYGDIIGWSTNVCLYADVEEPVIEVPFFREGQQVGAFKVPELSQMEESEIEYFTGEMVTVYTYEGENFSVTMRRLTEQERANAKTRGYQTVPIWDISGTIWCTENLPSNWTMGSNTPWPDQEQLIDSRTGEILINEMVGENFTRIWKP